MGCEGPGKIIAESGLLGYISMLWILLAWCTQILPDACSVGGLQAEWGVLVGCRQTERGGGSIRWFAAP